MTEALKDWHMEVRGVTLRRTDLGAKLEIPVLPSSKEQTVTCTELDLTLDTVLAVLRTLTLLTHTTAL